jgi:hypothetical protein
MCSATPKSASVSTANLNTPQFLSKNSIPDNVLCDLIRKLSHARAAKFLNDPAVGTDVFEERCHGSGGWVESHKVTVDRFFWWFKSRAELGGGVKLA